MVQCPSRHRGTRHAVRVPGFRPQLPGHHPPRPARRRGHPPARPAPRGRQREARRPRASYSGWTVGRRNWRRSTPSPMPPTTCAGRTARPAPASPGVMVGELVPMIAERLHRCALLRSMTHRVDSHSPVPMMTAFPTFAHFARGRPVAPQGADARHAGLRPPGSEPRRGRRRAGQRVRPRGRSATPRGRSWRCRSSACAPTCRRSGSATGRRSWRRWTARAPGPTPPARWTRWTYAQRRGGGDAHVAQGARRLRPREGEGGDPRPLRGQLLRAELPHGPPPGRGRHPLRGR